MSVGPEQFGLYVCEAANRHGSKAQTLEVYESKTPICPPLCGSTDLNGVPSSNYLSTKNIFVTLIISLIIVK